MARRPPPSHRVRMENDMIKKREKQYHYDQLWKGQKQYYEHWDKKNTKFEEWTSPRYHEENNKLIEKIKTGREHEDNLEKRRSKLRLLFAEEEKAYQVELMVHKTKNASFQRRRIEDVPTEVLEELNLGLKLEEDERKRHEAELSLYHQWRSSNPVLKHYERMQKSRDLKLSWLDQQVEKRMQREKEEEECRKILKDHEQILKEEEAKSEQHQRKLLAKKEELQITLEQQIKELKLKTAQSDELREKEEREYIQKNVLEQIDADRAEYERKKVNRECALYNIKQYKMRLKAKAKNIQEDLEREELLINKIKHLNINDMIEDKKKQDEIREALIQYLEVSKAQRKLEKTRQAHMDFLFDSEAKTQFHQQDEIWKREEAARKNLITDVLNTIHSQISLKLENNKYEQTKLFREREEILKNIEEYNNEIAELQKEEQLKKRETLKALEEDVKLKNAKKKVKENSELKRIDEELERVRKEEQRLKKEIMNIQMRQGPVRPPRSRLYF